MIFPIGLIKFTSVPPRALDYQKSCCPSSIGVESILSGPIPVTVVETPEFLAGTHELINVEERGLPVDYLARNPLAGDLIPGAGGVRKLGWALEGRGKRGGAGSILLSRPDHADLCADRICQERGPT